MSTDNTSTINVKSLDVSYALRRDHVAAVRLNFAQHLNMQATGYLLHPSMPVSPSARIAHVGCGTGMCLLDMASEVRDTVMLDGWDVSDRLFASAETLTENLNVRFGVLDVLSEGVGKDVVGRYDVVRVVMFCLVIKSARHLAVMLRNLVTTLKPGGYLMWLEGDMSDYHNRVANPPDPTLYPAMGELDRLAMATTRTCQPVEHVWILELPLHYEDAGRVDASLERYEVPRRYLRVWTEMMLLVTEEMYRNVAQEGMVKGVEGQDKMKLEDVLRLIEKAAEEIRRGAVALKLKPVVAVGRMPG